MATQPAHTSNSARLAANEADALYMPCLKQINEFSNPRDEQSIKILNRGRIWQDFWAVLAPEAKGRKQRVCIRLGSAHTSTYFCGRCFPRNRFWKCYWWVCFPSGQENKIIIRFWFLLNERRNPWDNGWVLICYFSILFQDIFRLMFWGD